MRVFRVNCDLDRYRSADFPRNSSDVAAATSNCFVADDRLAKSWKPLQLEWASYGQRLKSASIGNVNWINGLGAFDEQAIRCFADFADCCEVLPIRLEGKPHAHLVHIFSVDAFPRGNNYDSILGDFATRVNKRNLHSLFRGRIHLSKADRRARYYEGKSTDIDNPKWVPGVYIHATEQFVEQYEASGLTGLLFEPYWPLDDRLQFLCQKIREEAAAEERVRLMEGNEGKSSPMPKGKVPKPKINWKKNAKPTIEQFAGYLWQAVIDERMSGRWLGDANGSDTPDAMGITRFAAEAITRLLDAGIDRNVLCHLARSISFEAISATIRTFEDVGGIDWPNGEEDWETLKIALIQEATLGKDGKLGGWPPK